MSLMVAPELVAAAAADLTGIGQAISAANAAAAGPTTQVLAAAGDEVSAAIAALFGTHAQEYQALSARVATFHEQFVRSLTAAGSAYATAEAANASPLQALEQQVLGAINAPTQLWLGRQGRRRRRQRAGRPAQLRHGARVRRRRRPRRRRRNTLITG
nr:PE family protein [Mycobacterium tuberculosis]